MREICISLVTDSLGMNSVYTDRKHLFFYHREMKSDTKGFGRSLWCPICGIKFQILCLLVITQYFHCGSAGDVTSWALKDWRSVLLTPTVSECCRMPAGFYTSVVTEHRQQSLAQAVNAAFSCRPLAESLHSRTNSENYLLILNQALSCG